MNTLQHSDPFQKFLHFSFRALECVVTVGLGAFLILAWIVMSPLLRLGVYLSDLWRTRFNPKRRGGCEPSNRWGAPGRSAE
jgi:hypothetical protein